MLETGDGAADAGDEADYLMARYAGVRYFAPVAAGGVEVAVADTAKEHCKLDICLVWLSAFKFVIF
jgi:hypothetical protein